MTSRYSFLTSRRWLGLIAAAVAISVVCALLGYWQWSRYQGRADQVALVEANFDQDPVPLTDLVSRPGAELDPAHQWHPVQVQGRYLGEVVVLPQRGVAGNPADHVVGVLAVDVGHGPDWAVLVDRGWYTTDTFADHAAAQELPNGQVTTTMRLRPAEAPSPRVLDAGQIHRLNPTQALTAATGTEEDDSAGYVLATGIYGQLAAETEGGSDVVPAELNLLPRPVADLGSHLSYALQWWVFALGLYVALVILARREARDPRAPAPVRRRADADEDEAIETQIQASATSSA
ncbi:SURF1 family protein [Pseudactinotalea sp. Z1739]|uniref:SURF1 family protein n=1 Tax=Pseudactinotalea sp. Z1739 TaxID=3413028 RepID=UPI003C7A0145